MDEDLTQQLHAEVAAQAAHMKSIANATFRLHDAVNELMASLPEETRNALMAKMQAELDAQTDS